MNVVIVGGGIAGVSTATGLRDCGFDGGLTIVDAGEFPHDRPPLTKSFLAGRSDHGQIALQPPEWYSRHSVELLTRASVTALRPHEGRVELADGRSLPADRVVLATGGRAARPPIPGIDAVQVHTVRTVDDADRLRAVLVSGARVLVVGAGLIGAEVASTAAGLGCEVVVVDPIGVPLAHAVGPELAEWLHDRHRVHGVTTIHARVVSLRAFPATTAAVLTGEEHARVFDVVVIGVGMVPETTLAEAAGLTVDGGVLVNAGQITSNPAVLAVGDPARNGAGRAEHWEAAQLDGIRAAATLLDRAGPAPAAPWYWSDRYGNHLEVVGRMADAMHTVVRGVLDHPPFAVFGLRGDRVIAAATVDDSNAARAARRLIDRAVPVDQRKLADPSVHLRSLLRS
ncbi:FAD-dependent oxidoreductase [Micromonospora sp. NBC_01392]|uniref:NAD(P)/FAD-dependent oxidoreductase n=1 Tax=Micromonospora sp. NBC_01392 TaxID=2903588 RepID=UPI003254A9D5